MATVRLSMFALLLLLASCAGGAKDKDKAEELNPQERAAYEQCLRENQMVAMAWEVIEQQCLDKVRQP